MTSTGIQQLWNELQSNGCLQEGIFTMKASDRLASPGLKALIGDTDLFPKQCLSIKLSHDPVVEDSIVLNGTLQSSFLGQDWAAAVATFNLDNSGLATLELVVFAQQGPVLASAFPGLALQCAPAIQKFTTAQFTACSGTPPTLQFSGNLDLDSINCCPLWPSPQPQLSGFITTWSKTPAFQLSTLFTSAIAQVGNTKLKLQISLTATDADPPSQKGQIVGTISDDTWDDLQVSCPLPIGEENLIYLDNLELNKDLKNLGQLASLFKGEQLATLIPAQFSLGDGLNFTSIVLQLDSGTGNLAMLEIAVSTSSNLNWPLLPDNLLTLRMIQASFSWTGVNDLDITLSGCFNFGGSQSLGFDASFDLKDKQLTATNTGDICCGDLLGIFGGLQSPCKEMHIKQKGINLALSIPDKIWYFTCEVAINGWEIPLMGPNKISFDKISLSILQTSSTRTITLNAEATMLGATFTIDATADSASKTWSITGSLDETLQLNMVLGQLLPFTIPGDITRSLGLDKIEIEQLSVSLDEKGNFNLASGFSWMIPGFNAGIDATLSLVRQDKQYSGSLCGVVEILGLVLAVRYDFSPSSKDLSFSYQDLTVSYHKDGDAAIVAISLGQATVGELFTFLLSFAAPHRTISLGAPWDAFEKIQLPDITLTVNLKTKAISIEIDHAVDLGFLDLDRIVLNYTRAYGSPQFNLELTGTFLGQAYGSGNNAPLAWDVLNQSPPAVASAGTKLLDLEFLGIGQRVAIAGNLPTQIDAILDGLEREMQPPADPNSNPIPQLQGIVYDASSSWLIGTRFTLASTVSIDLIFNDPVLYGLMIQLKGDKAGPLAGLRFEIIYRKISDSIGVYHIDLTIPDEMRHLELGEVSITLPVVTLDVYTNGNFRVDFGYPPSLTDFSRSFSIQLFPFTGFAGLYFAMLNGQTANSVPAVSSGQFGTVLEFGFALQIGVGKSLSLGILSGGISITVGGSLQGVLAWYTPNDSSLPTERFHNIEGTVSLVGNVYATVDFGIISASVSLTVYAVISLEIISYRAILIQVSAGVSVAVSIKIIFFTIHFSFDTTITESFLIGADAPPPRTLADAGGSANNDTGVPSLAAFRSNVLLLLRQPPYALLRSRPPRTLSTISDLAVNEASPAPAKNCSVPVFVCRVLSQAQGTDFLYPAGTTPPTKTPTLAILLGLQTSSVPDQGANALMRELLNWSMTAIGHEHVTISAAVVEEVLESLCQPSACDHYFKYADLTRFFTNNGITFILSSQTETEQDDLPVALLAMIPELSLKTPEFSIDFKADRLVNPQFEHQLREYFSELSAKFGSQKGTPLDAASNDIPEQPAAAESLATFLFRYQFFLLTKAVLQAVRDLLASSIVELKSPSSLNSIVNLFNNNYTTRANDTLASIAQMFGVSVEALRAANPILTNGGPKPGDRLLVPGIEMTYISQANDSLAALADCFGLNPADLQGANPQLDFSNLKAGTSLSIPAMRVVHTVQDGESLVSIAKDFAIDPAQLASVNPEGIQRVGTHLLIPLQLKALAVATANAQTAGLLNAVTITLNNISLRAQAKDSISSIANSLNLRVIDLLSSNAESLELLNPGQQINLGNLSTTTRAKDSLDGLWAYWYNRQTITLQAFNAANPNLTISAGQTIIIPQGTDKSTTYTSVTGDTTASLLNRYNRDIQILTIDDLYANNKTLFFDAGQAVALPNVVHNISRNYQIAYTVTTGDSYNSISQDFFASERIANAQQLLQQINGSAMPEAGSIIQIPYASSISNIRRHYGVKLANLADNTAMSQASLLAPSALINVASIKRVLTPTDSLASLAQSYNLSMDQLIHQLADVEDLFAATSISIPAIPAMRTGRLNQALALTGKFTNALRMTSRFMMGGLRIPAPSFISPGSSAPTITSMQKQPTYPLYGLVGQEFPIDPKATTAYTIQLSTGSLSWVTLPTQPIHLAQEEVDRISALSTLDFDPGVEAGSAAMVQPFTLVPDRHPPAALLWWQTPDLPNLNPSNNSAILKPSIWLLPAIVIDSLVASTTGELAYAGHRGVTNMDGSVNNLPLTASRYATVLDLTIETTQNSPPGLYTMIGTDQEDLPRLIAIWHDLKASSQQADLHIAYASQDHNAARGTFISEAINRQSCFLLKTNLTTETTSAIGSTTNALVMPSDETSTPSHCATLETAKSLDFLQYLWECSSTASGGFYFRYDNGTDKPGFPEGLFSASNSAEIKLIIVPTCQEPNSPFLKAYTNALIVGDAIDPAHDKLHFEALYYTVAKNDTLTSVAQALFQRYPDLGNGFNASELASINQLIPGLLNPGMTISGQITQSDDSLLSFAQRASLTISELATACATLACLRPGALLQVRGEPTQTVMEGDTLASIAANHSFLDPGSLANLNAITANLLFVGQSLRVPGHEDHVIVQGDTLSGIAKTFGVAVSVLGEANAFAPALKVGAIIIIAADSLHTVGSLPPGHAGWTLTRSAPKPTVSNTPLTALQHLYHMIGFRVVSTGGSSTFRDSGEGLPATPITEKAGGDSEGWHYRQLLDISGLAADTPLPYPSLLPSADGNPYSGIRTGSTLSLQLMVQDMLGNRTAGSTLPGDSLSTLTAPVGYSDELISLTGWPSLIALYRFGQQKNNSSSADNLFLSLSFSINNFLPDASAVISQQASSTVLQARATIRAGQAQARLTEIFYQLFQPDVECAVSTTLGTITDPLTVFANSLAALRGLASSALIYLANARCLRLTTTTPSASCNTLSSLSQPATTSSGAGYAVSLDDLASVNAEMDASLMFNDSQIKIPAYLATRDGETPSAILERASIAAENIGSFVQENADTALNPGVLLRTPPRQISSQQVGLSLSAMARSLCCSLKDGAGDVAGLANANATVVLATGIVIVFDGIKITTGTADTMTTVAQTLAKQTSKQVTPLDVAIANQNVMPFFASTATPSIASALIADGDTLNSFGKRYGDISALEVWKNNQLTPNIWPAATGLITTYNSYTIASGDTLNSIARTNQTTPALILSANKDAQLSQTAQIIIPWSAEVGLNPGGSYTAQGNISLSEIVAQFNGWTLNALVNDHLNWQGLFSSSTITIGSKSIIPTITDTFASLANSFGIDPLNFAQQVATLPGMIRAGAVFITPAWQTREHETLAACAQRFATDPVSLATANSSLPDLFIAGNTFEMEGTQVCVYTNDSFAMILARLNAQRNKAGQPAIDANALAMAAISLPLAARTLIGVPGRATLGATVTPSTHSPILSLSVDLSITRDPSLAAPAFANAARVVTATTMINAAPFAGTGGTTGTLAEFATAFEATFPGYKLATGPKHTTPASALGTPSLRAMTAGGTGSSSSGTVRSLWVVNFSQTGITYSINSQQPRFFAVQPLTIYAYSADDVGVPTYTSQNGLSTTKTPHNFRNEDPEKWHYEFLKAVDLALSPAYASAAQTDSEAQVSLNQIIAAKADLADKLSKLVASIDHGQSDGLSAAQETMKQQLLVNLSGLYSTQAIIQWGIDIGGTNSSIFSNQPLRLSGKLAAVPLMTPETLSSSPFADLASKAGVAADYLAEFLAHETDLIMAGVITRFRQGSGTKQYTTQNGDTLTIVANKLGVSVSDLPSGLILDPGGSLFRPCVPVNVSSVSVPTNLATVSECADWLAINVSDLLAANADRTDFFTPNSTLQLNQITVTPSPQDTLATIAKAHFTDLVNLAMLLSNVDARTAEGMYKLNQQAPPRALQALPQISLHSSKATLQQDGTLTTLLTVAKPTAQRNLILNLDYNPNHLEFDIHSIPGIDGYEGSSWLSFIHQLANSSDHIGTVSIPIALRGYPLPAVISNQQAVPVNDDESVINTLSKWNYVFNIQRSIVAQDQMRLQLLLNDTKTSTTATSSLPARIGVVKELAGFSVIWPDLSKDLAKLPQLFTTQVEEDRTSARNALSALASTVVAIQQAWQGSAQDEAAATGLQQYEYALSTLFDQDGRVESLLLDRLSDTTGSAAQNPDDFLFLTAETNKPVLSGSISSALEIPQNLRTDFKNNGFTLSQSCTVNQEDDGWILIDNGDFSNEPAISPQTYKIKAGQGTSLQVWREILWPEVSITSSDGSILLNSTQSGTRLTYTINTANPVPADGVLNLQFAFRTLDVFRITSAWAGLGILRNANLHPNVNPAYIYRTSISFYSTRISPLIQRAKPIPLHGKSLPFALITFFNSLFSGDTAVNPSAERNIRVEAAYWRSPSGADPSKDPLCYRIPLILVPNYTFNPAKDVNLNDPTSFCNQLSQTMASTAAALDLHYTPSDQWVLDILIYGVGQDSYRQLLSINSCYFPVSVDPGSQPSLPV